MSRKTIKLLATRADGFKIEGKFRCVNVEQDCGIWVNADGRMFVCDKVVLEVEKKPCTQ